jgi:hypothetical protein
MGRRSPRLRALLCFFAVSSASLTAFDLAGVVPEAAFPGDEPSFLVEMLNDTTSFRPAKVESDDLRSFGVQVYGSLRGFALGLAYEGFTFRGDPPEAPSRADELALTAAWMGPPIGEGSLRLRLGGGAGLRAWGYFGFDRIQGAWHRFIGVDRPMPSDYAAAYARPFAYLAADVGLGQGRPISGDASFHLLGLGTTGIESSITARAMWSEGVSENWAGLRRQDRLGAFAECDAKANAYEGGTWLVLGSRTGFLSFENAVNASVPFAIGTIACRFGGEAKPRLPGPRQELAIGTTFFESSFSMSRFVIIMQHPELHVGLEAALGVSHAELDELGPSAYQAAIAVAEIFTKERRGPRFFAGLAGGMRQDVWSDTDLQRSALIDRSICAVGKAYAGMRLLSLSVPSPSHERVSVDFGGAIFAANRPFPPPGGLLFLRLSLADP